MSLKSQLQEIQTFRDDYTRYLEVGREDEELYAVSEEAIALRAKLNRAIPLVTSNISSVGEPTHIYYSPPPMVGGIRGNLDLLANLFNLSTYQIAPQMVLDMLDRAEGRYNLFIKRRKYRLFNPIFWIGELIRIPFNILKFAGFDSVKIELSLFGKIYKAAAGLVALIVGLIKIWQFIEPFLFRVNGA